MRKIRLYIAVMMALCAVMLSACAVDDGSARRPDSLGQWIWYAVNEDLDNVNDIFMFADSAYSYICMDDEAAQQEFQKNHLAKYEITHSGSTYYFTEAATSTTTITTTVTLHEDRMELSRTGGSSYKLVIKPYANDLYTATFSSLCFIESEGSAEFRVKVMGDAAARTIAYKGDMQMVDREESATKPLTLDTRISDWLCYNVARGIYTEGRMFIDCYDERYGSHDEVRVLINNEIVYITIFGKTEMVGQ